MSEIKTIFWDFDGVILNSNEVRDMGFEELFKEYTKEQVAALMDFHRTNGGWSRYVKIRYFYEEVLGKSITEEEVNLLAGEFSVIMKKKLVDPSLLIQETVDFIKNNAENYTMYITSGSDQTELRYLCAELGLASYFKSIHGSPKAKIKWVEELIDENQLNKQECVLVGDSINDWEAADKNGIYFMGYNNPAVEQKTNYSLPIK